MKSSLKASLKISSPNIPSTKFAFTHLLELSRPELRDALKSFDTVIINMEGELKCQE